MKRIAILSGVLFATVFPGLAGANDGGIYAVQPFGAKYDKASHTFTFTGQYAQELKKLLPPSFSVLTNMQPELKNPYDKNFRGLSLKDAQGNGLDITCTSADVAYQGEKSSIKEKSETVCTVQLPADNEGDVNKVTVQQALDKANQANQIK